MTVVTMELTIEPFLIFIELNDEEEENTKLRLFNLKIFEVFQ